MQNPENELESQSMTNYDFFGAEEAKKLKAKNRIYKGIETPADLYDKLTKIWCCDSCAPRMRKNWSPANRTLGQCSITAFLAQDIFGGDVYEMPTENGGVHCYNKVDGIVFDLTSEQFGEKAASLVYDCAQKGDRNSEKHLAKAEKKARYEYIRSRLEKNYDGHVFFVRHGETVWNVENKICGATDSPLTDKGRQQAKDAARKILEQGIKFDRILYSPLSRARDTAMAISEATGIEPVMEVRLIEQNFGKWEGTNCFQEEFLKAKCSLAQDFDGGESMLKLCQRIYGLLDQIREDKEHTYLLVAHNGIARAVNSYFNSMTNEEYGLFGLKNCEIKRYDF